MVKILISFDRKHLYFFLFGIGVIILFGFGMAYNSGYGGGYPSVFGHSADELNVNIGGNYKTLQAAIDAKDFGDNTWLKSGSDISFNGGNVGIGTAGVPSQKLDVIGIIRGQKFEDDDPNYYIDMNVGGRIKGLTVDDVIQGSISGNANYATTAGSVVGGGGGGGTVTSVGSGVGLTGGPITSSGSLMIDFARANTWTGQTTFSNDVRIDNFLRLSERTSAPGPCNNNDAIGGLIFMYRNVYKVNPCVCVNQGLTSPDWKWMTMVSGGVCP